MNHTDGAARLGLQDRIPFGIDRHHHIGAFTPIIRDRQGDVGALRADGKILDRQDAVGGDNNLCLPLIGRHDGYVGALAGRRRLVRPDDTHPVRGLGPIF